MLESLAIYAFALAVVAFTGGQTAPNGYTADDPCFSCGEDWEFYPNAPLTFNGKDVYVNKPQWQENLDGK